MYARIQFGLSKTTTRFRFSILARPCVQSPSAVLHTQMTTYYDHLVAPMHFPSLNQVCFFTFSYPFMFVAARLVNSRSHI